MMSTPPNWVSGDIYVAKPLVTKRVTIDVKRRDIILASIRRRLGHIGEWISGRIGYDATGWRGIIFRLSMRLPLYTPGLQCPIARAGNRALGDETFVDNTHLSTEQRLWVSLPGSARTFVKAYDAKLPVKPFRFELEVPVE